MSREPPGLTRGVAAGHDDHGVTGEAGEAVGDVVPLAKFVHQALCHWAAQIGDDSGGVVCSGTPVCQSLSGGCIASRGWDPSTHAAATPVAQDFAPVVISSHKGEYLGDSAGCIVSGGQGLDIQEPFGVVCGGQGFFGKGGSHGNPLIALIKSTSHCSPSAILVTVRHLTAPLCMPINTSSILSMIPNQIPIFFAGSPCYPLTILSCKNITFSPKNTNGVTHGSLRILSYGVLPSLPLVYFDIVSAAHLTIQAMIGESSFNC